MISLHLYRTVATDCLVMVAGDCIVKGIDAYIQDTEIRIFIFEQHLIYRARFVGR